MDGGKITARDMKVITSTCYLGIFLNISSIFSGIARALQTFDKLKTMRSNPDIVASHHIVFIANSATYDIPVMENVKYTGNTLDQLTNLIKVTD